MSNPDLILTLGKVIIATAWADGNISPDEMNSLKDVTFHLPKITAIQWAELEIYMETPVGEAERARLIEELRQIIASPQDRELAMSALDDLVNADGVVTPEEQAVVDEVKAALVGSSGPFGGLSRFVGNLLHRREKSLENAPNREEHFEDYIKNKVYYKVQQRLNKENTQLNVSDEELRKLCLAGGIMAQVARVQAEITDDEFAVIAETLRDGWGINPEAAAFVTEVAISDAVTGFDKLRLSREFLKVCTTEECNQFLQVLFRVAAADGQISEDEIEHIRKIAKELLLSGKQFANARQQALARLDGSV